MTIKKIPLLRDDKKGAYKNTPLTPMKKLFVFTNLSPNIRRMPRIPK